jgi:hypothetical protein
MARTTRWRRWWRRRRLVELVRHPVASASPSRSAGVLEWGLQWWRRTSLFEPVAPTPSYSAARQGPTSLLTGWASPIRTRVKGPMGRWAHWWRDQSNKRDCYVLVPPRIKDVVLCLVLRFLIQNMMSPNFSHLDIG